MLARDLYGSCVVGQLRVSWEVFCRRVLKIDHPLSSILLMLRPELPGFTCVAKEMRPKRSDDLNDGGYALDSNV